MKAKRRARRRRPQARADDTFPELIEMVQKRHASAGRVSIVFFVWTRNRSPAGGPEKRYKGHYAVRLRGVVDFLAASGSTVWGTVDAAALAAEWAGSARSRQSERAEPARLRLLFEADFILDVLRSSLEARLNSARLLPSDLPSSGASGAKMMKSDHENNDQLRHADGTKHMSPAFPKNATVDDRPIILDG